MFYHYEKIFYGNAYCLIFVSLYMMQQKNRIRVMSN